MELRKLFSLIWINILVKGVQSGAKDANNLQYFSKNSDPCPNECDPKKCDKLSYCSGHVEKDRCNCCDVCAADTTWSPALYRPPLQKGGACEQVKCPKRKVCVENMQGLPLCTCPNAFICRSRKRKVCGVDGNTYQSKCHMRVASCTTGKRIRLKHKGACNSGMIATQQYSGKVKYPEGEFDLRRRRRKNRRKEKRKHKKDRLRQKKRRRRKKQRKQRLYLRGRKQKTWRHDKKNSKTLSKRKRNKRRGHIRRLSG